MTIGVGVLLVVATHPDSGNPLVWAHEINESRVVTIQLGDSPPAYKNSPYRRLPTQCIPWVAER